MFEVTEKASEMIKEFLKKSKRPASHPDYAAGWLRRPRTGYGSG